MKLVLSYLIENSRGGVRYPWPGDQRAQPGWFMELYSLAERIQQETLAEKQERGQNEKKYNMG